MANGEEERRPAFFQNTIHTYDSLTEEIATKCDNVCKVCTYDIFLSQNQGKTNLLSGVKSK